MVLPEGRRTSVILALQHYREAVVEVAAVEEELASLRSPAHARWSQVGAARGRPGNPTQVRALRALELRGRHGRAAFLAHALDLWVWAPDRHPDDRLLLALVHGMHRPERLPLLDAARAVGIPCGTAEERGSLERHYCYLLAQVAQHLDVLARTWRWAA